MLLRPRKHPRSADEPVSPAEVAETLYAMGLMAWMIAPAPFLWAPPLWALALMSPPPRASERPREGAPAVVSERVPPAIAQQPPEPAFAVPPQIPPAALPRAARPPRLRPRPHRAKEPR